MSHLEDGALPSTRDGVHETADLLPPPVPTSANALVANIYVGSIFESWTKFREDEIFD